MIAVSCLANMFLSEHKNIMLYKFDNYTILWLVLCTCLLIEYIYFEWKFYLCFVNSKEQVWIYQRKYLKLIFAQSVFELHTSCILVAEWLNFGCKVLEFWLQSGCRMVGFWLKKGWILVVTWRWINVIKWRLKNFH